MAEYHMTVTYKVLGGHTHMQIRTGQRGYHLGLAGELSMTNEDFSAWRNSTGEALESRIDGQMRVEFMERK